MWLQASLTPCEYMLAAPIPLLLSRIAKNGDRALGKQCMCIYVSNMSEMLTNINDKEAIASGRVT